MKKVSAILTTESEPYGEIEGITIMDKMTSKERIQCILNHEKPDRIGVHEHFWGITTKNWEKNLNGLPFNDVIKRDIRQGGWPNIVADLDFEPIVIAETDDTVTKKDKNYATLKTHKKHDSTPEHIAYDIDCREKWEELVKPKLLNKDDYLRRVNFDGYMAAKEDAEKHGQFFCYDTVNVFESIHPLIGHVNLLMAMIDDPEWVMDMSQTYAQLQIDLQEILFDKCGNPDGVFYYEDMGYKGSPFMSPDMYREFIFPSHKKTIDFAKSRNLPVIMHSCGFVEPLLPDMVKAGINCLQAMEVKAGMDLLRIYENFGDKIALMGGIDVRTLCTNDKKIIDEELEAKIPVVKQKYGYVLHSDHSIPGEVTFDTYCYFVKKAFELGSY